MPFFEIIFKSWGDGGMVEW